MKEFLKYLGPILQIIAVILLGIYYKTGPADNTLLTLAGLLVIAGIVVHIFINNKIKE